MSGRLTYKELSIYFGIDYLERSQCEKVYGAWRQGRLVGKGAYGKVYEACKQEDCKYILKVIRYDSQIFQLSGGSSRSIKDIYNQWFQEIDMHVQMNRCQQGFRCQFSPMLYDAWYCAEGQDVTFYMVMEKFEGNLYNFLDKFKRSKVGGDVWTLLNSYISDTFIYKLVLALEFVHETCNICINDIKLENVLYKKVDDKFLFVFADFGISGQCTRSKDEKCKKEDTARLTATITTFLETFRS
jgi:serine/threonine protein kinase